MHGHTTNTSMCACKFIGQRFCFLLEILNKNDFISKYKGMLFAHYHAFTQHECSIFSDLCSHYIWNEVEVSFFFVYWECSGYCKKERERQRQNHTQNNASRKRRWWFLKNYYNKYKETGGGDGWLGCYATQPNVYNYYYYQVPIQLMLLLVNCMNI